MKFLILFSLILLCSGNIYYIYADEFIPFWIKNNALWWSEDKASTDEFAIGLDWLMFDGLLSSSYSLENKIPFWTKDIARYWAHDLISDIEFLNSIEYLLVQNIISIKNTVSLPDYREHVYSGNNELFTIYAYEKDFYFENNVPIPRDTQFELKKNIPNLHDILYDSKKQNAVVIVPLFTSSAYWEPGFYTFFRNECGSECLTTKIEYANFLGYSASSNAVKILSLLGYPMINDIDLDNNPELLNQFDDILVLHNEYVTQNEFDAITNHPSVLHLYPNSLYGHISVNYSDDTVTLIRGHAYPEDNIDNGFDWENENTRPYEFDSECLNWDFYSISNGNMLNCYPENLFFEDFEFLKEIKHLTLKK